MRYFEYGVRRPLVFYFCEILTLNISIMNTIVYQSEAFLPNSDHRNGTAAPFECGLCLLHQTGIAWLSAYLVNQDTKLTDQKAPSRKVELLLFVVDNGSIQRAPEVQCFHVSEHLPQQRQQLLHLLLISVRTE